MIVCSSFKFADKTVFVYKINISVKRSGSITKFTNTTLMTLVTLPSVFQSIFNIYLFIYTNNDNIIIQCKYKARNSNRLIRNRLIINEKTFTQEESKQRIKVSAYNQLTVLINPRLVLLQNFNDRSTMFVFHVSLSINVSRIE